MAEMTRKDPTISRELELMRRGIGSTRPITNLNQFSQYLKEQEPSATAEGISKGFEPIRRGIGKYTLNPLATLQDLAAGAGEGLYGLAADASGGIASALGAPEFGQDMFTIADKSYDSAKGRLAEALGPGQVIKDKGFSPADNEQLLDIFGPDPSIGRPEGMVPGKATIKPGTEGLPKKQIPDPSSNVDAAARLMMEKKQTEADARREISANREPKTMYDMPSEPVPDADPAEQLFSQAMSEYISQARTGAEDDLPELGDIEDYKKKFAKATGVDISGKPDTSQALMAMGLSMMQNRAGKGFNVGRMLSSVGEAGEKALPALTAAKAEARNNVIAAGKYALTAQDADEKTRKAAEKDLMNRGKYWVFSKGGKDGEFSNFEKGEFVDLNKAEMNKLITDPKFDEKYSFVDATTRFDILAKRAEGQELGDMWGKKPEAVSLIGGAAKDVPAELQVFGTYANPNYSGKSTSRIKLSEEPQAVINRFLSYQDSIDKGAVKFKELLENVDEGISIGEQFLGSAQQFLINVGVEADTSTVAKAKQALKNFAIDEATNILKESGKTLSDGDRQLVKERVGQIDWANADPKLLKRQIEFVYEVVVLKAQRNLDTAVGKLESDFGISVRPTTKSGPKDQAEVDEFNKMYGTEFTMETFPKD